MSPDFPASGFLDLPGAVEGDGADAGVAAHYGNPLREQRALAGGEAIVDLSHRAVLSVSGEDRLTWLNSITSQSLATLAPGISTETLLLDQTGRMEYAARVIDDGTVVWLLLERADAPRLLAWLESMRFALRVEVADRSAEFATVGAMDSLPTGTMSTGTVPADTMPADTIAAGSALGALRLPAAAPNGIEIVWRDPWSTVSPGGHQYAAAEAHPASDWHWSERLVARSEMPGLVARVAAGEIRVAGFLAVEALRIAAWRPRFATEVDEKTIPHELDWLRSAVHLRKGCYRGQETVAKVHNLGHPPRRLVMLHLDGSEGVLPAPDDEVTLAGKVVGRVTSAALHYELGPIALAVVRRTTDPAAVLTVVSGGLEVAAAQEIIVPTDAGATATVPRLPRLGAPRRGA